MKGLPALLVLALACGGGGGGGGTPTAPTPRLTFTPAGGGAELALATGAGSTNARLRLDLVASAVTDLYGVAFELGYPAQVLRYVEVGEGTLLSDGDLVQTSFQAVEIEPGRLLVGLTRLGAVGGASGSGVLMSFVFDAIGAGAGAIAFAEERAFDPTGATLASVDFAGGTVQYAP